MKLKLLDHLRMNQPSLIATFGQAQIVRHPNGRYELRGGTPDDHTAAREWASMFMNGALHQSGGLRSKGPPVAR